MNDISREILTEIEIDKVIQFCADPIMSMAVQKFVLASLYKQGVIERGVPHNARINWAMNLSWGATDGRGVPRSDEELGQNLRAMTFAVQLVESGFKEISEIKKAESVEESVINPSE